MNDACTHSPARTHCWHNDPKPDYSRPKPYRSYCCWCGAERFEAPLSKIPDHGPCNDATCREKQG